MDAIKTNYKYNFDKAENDVFSWSHWDGTNGGILRHKASGRSIYQMHWLNEKGKMAEEVTGETRKQALDFWAELAQLEAQKQPETDEDYDYEPEHGVDGYCRKCHSYCYGDCEAN